MARVVLRAMGVLAVAAAVYVVVTAVQVWLASNRDEARPAQAIVVMGSAEYDGRPSADLASRLDHAYGLWRHGIAPLVVVTGGRLPGDVYTESGVSAAYLERLGLGHPSDIVEVGGNTSYQSLSLAASALKARGDSTVVLVSDPFHSARIAAISRALGLTGYTSPTRTSPIRGVSTVPYFAEETAGVALGRLIGYQSLTAVHDGVDVARRYLFIG